MNAKGKKPDYEPELPYSEIIIKFIEGGPLEIGDDGRLYAKHLNLDRFYQIVEANDAEAVRSSRVDTEILRRLNEKASERLKVPPPNLDLYVRVRPNQQEDVMALFSQLKDDADLEEYIENISLALPPGPPPTPDFSNQQGYLDDSASGGVDTRFAWNLFNNSGAGAGNGVRVCDCEYGYNETHEDLSVVDVIYNIDNKLDKHADHGTSVLGILAGKNNMEGVIGICYGADILFASETGDGTPDQNRRDLIDYIIEKTDPDLPDPVLRPGDVLLLEMQTQGLLPAEFNDDFRNAVTQLVFGRDIIVVACAGNQTDTHGSNNLKNKKSIWDPNSPDYHDSGAILVGAGKAAQQTNPHSKLPASCHGERVDCQGWGAKVVTTGKGDLHNGGPDATYTQTFSGTSSAAAIVAGVVACLQGVARANRSVLEPDFVRTLLRDSNNGIPQADSPQYPAVDFHIGPLPDLKKLIKAAGF